MSEKIWELVRLNETREWEKKMERETLFSLDHITFPNWKIEIGGFALVGMCQRIKTAYQWA